MEPIMVKVKIRINVLSMFKKVYRTPLYLMKITP